MLGIVIAFIIIFLIIIAGAVKKMVATMKNLNKQEKKKVYRGLIFISVVAIIFIPLGIYYYWLDEIKSPVILVCILGMVANFCVVLVQKAENRELFDE